MFIVHSYDVHGMFVVVVVVLSFRFVVFVRHLVICVHVCVCVNSIAKLPNRVILNLAGECYLKDLSRISDLSSLSSFGFSSSLLSSGKLI